MELYFFSLECNEMSSNELWDVYGFGVDTHADPGGPLELWLALPVRALPHDLVMGGNLRAGSQQQTMSGVCYGCWQLSRAFHQTPLYQWRMENFKFGDQNLCI